MGLGRDFSGRPPIDYGCGVVGVLDQGVVGFIFHGLNGGCFLLGFLAGIRLI